MYSLVWSKKCDNRFGGRNSLLYVTLRKKRCATIGRNRCRNMLRNMLRNPGVCLWL